jgi:hypothetical protein
MKTLEHNTRHACAWICFLNMLSAMQERSLRSHIQQLKEGRFPVSKVIEWMERDLKDIEAARKMGPIVPKTSA